MSDNEVTISFGADISTLKDKIEEVKGLVGDLSDKLSQSFNHLDGDSWQTAAGQMRESFAGASRDISEIVAQSQQSMTASYRAGASGRMLLEQQQADLVSRLNSKNAEEREAAIDEQDRRTKGRLDDEIRVARVGLGQKMSLLAEETRAKSMTHDEELELTKAAREQEYLFERNLLQQKLDLSSLEYKERARIDDQINALDQKHAVDMQRLTLRSVEETIRPWEQGFQRVSSSMSSSITGMINGSTRLSDMMRNLALSMVGYFVQSNLRMVADWASGVAARVALTQVGQAQETAATAAGNIARTQLDASGMASGAAAKTAGAMRSIMSSSAETFAGVFGFMSPMMGPAAAAPATAAQATVAGVQSLVGYDIGAWDLPHDQLAMVHKNELVMPAAEAGAFRQFLSQIANDKGSAGGRSLNVSPTLNLQVQAMDGSSVASTLNNNRDGVMKSLEKMVRQGAHLGLRGLNRD